MSRNKTIRIETDLEPVRLTIHKAIPASLLLNELVVNAYKHAFAARTEGGIRVTLSQTDGEIELIIGDDGVGLPPDFDPFHQKTLGMTLVKKVVQQIHAQLQVESGSAGPDQGSRFIIRFREG